MHVRSVAVSQPMRRLIGVKPVTATLPGLEPSAMSVLVQKPELGVFMHTYYTSTFFFLCSYNIYSYTQKTINTYLKF